MQRYSIRPMQEGEEPAIRNLMGLCFEPSLRRIFFIHQDSTLVAVGEDDSIVAGINCDIYRVRKTVKMGYIGFLYTHPDHRGNGLAGKLVEQALSFLQEKGCTDICGCVEGDNPASSKQLVSRGFSILSLWKQCRLFRHGLPKVYHHASRFFDMGYFLFHRSLVESSPKQPENHPLRRFLATTIGNTLLWALCLKGWNLTHFVAAMVGYPDFAGGYRGPIEDALPWQLLLIPTLFLALRTMAMLGSARIQHVEAEFRSWDTAWLAGLLLPLLFGIPFPVPGNVYIQGYAWNAQRKRFTLSNMARSAQMAVGIGCMLLFRTGGILWPLILLYLDTLFFFYPFCGFNAKRFKAAGKGPIVNSLAVLLVVSLFVLL